MKYIASIPAYYKTFGHTPPINKDFDIRPFEQYYEEDRSTMPVFKMEPFRVEFYGIGLMTQGSASKHLGKKFDSNLVLYSPYQILSFDGVERNWKGYYILFNQDFLDKCAFGPTFLQEFSFLRLDNVHPIMIPEDKVDMLMTIFKNIYSEFQGLNPDKYTLIEIQLNLLLHYIKRETTTTAISDTEYRSKAEIGLVAQYQSLIDTTFSKAGHLNPDCYSTALFSAQLNIHQNHLNAVTKRITNKTAKQLIQDAAIHLAKSLLLQSVLSVKEISYQMGFYDPAHFNNFFKKALSITPTQYRRTIA